MVGANNVSLAALVHLAFSAGSAETSKLPGPEHVGTHGLELMELAGSRHPLRIRVHLTAVNFSHMDVLPEGKQDVASCHIKVFGSVNTVYMLIVSGEKRLLHPVILKNMMLWMF